METVLKTKFFGVVHLKEWMKFANGRNYSAISGWVRVIPAKEAVGFVPGDKEANWVAVITKNENPKAKEPTVVMLGCQIRGFEAEVTTHDRDIYHVGSKE